MNNSILKTFMLTVALVASAHWGLAQTVTVNSAGGADFTTINDAMSAVASNAEEPNIIEITGGGPYNEVIIIDVPLTLRGASPDDRPIILIRQNDTVSGREVDGIVNTAAVDMTFENLIFLPSTDATPSDDGFDLRPFSDDDLFNITLRNVLISANNGNDEPLSTDGLEEQDFAGSTAFGDDGFQILSTFSGIPSGTINALLDGVVVTHIDADGDTTVAGLGKGQDGLILGGENLTVTMRNTVVSYGDRYGMQLLSNVTVNMEGTPTEPIVAKGYGFSGIRCFSGDHVWSYVQCLENHQGITTDVDTTFTQAFDHILVANSVDFGIGLLYAPDAPKTFTYTDCTFFNNPSDILVSPQNESDAPIKNNLTVSFIDSIFAGFDAFDFLVMTEEPLGGQVNLEFNNSAIVEEGPNAVIKDFNEENGIENGVIASDPEFLSTDPADENYLRVSADAFRTAASDGGLLSGAFAFAGEPVSVQYWMMME